MMRYEKEIPNLTFFCFSLTDKTDEMFDIMRKSCQNLFIAPNPQPEEFLKSVLSSISYTLLRHGMWS